MSCLGNLQCFKMQYRHNNVPAPLLFNYIDWPFLIESPHASFWPDDQLGLADNLCNWTHVSTSSVSMCMASYTCRRSRRPSLARQAWKKIIRDTITARTTERQWRILSFSHHSSVMNNNRWSLYVGSTPTHLCVCVIFQHLDLCKLIKFIYPLTMFFLNAFESVVKGNQRWYS